MKYTGAAAATVISQFVAGVGGLIYMLKAYPILRPHRSDWKSFRLWGGHIALGLPMALQFSITAIGSIIQQTALNSLDKSMPGIVTAYTAATKISNFATTPFDALGVTFATYAGQNFGAKEYGRIKDGVFAGMCYALGIWAVGLALCTFLGRPLTGIFLDKTTATPLCTITKFWDIPKNISSFRVRFTVRSASSSSTAIPCRESAAPL